jgi:hypothetical protein
MAALGSITRLGFNRWLRRHRTDTGKLRNRIQQLLAMAERRDADVLEIIVGQSAQQFGVDIVGAENLGILARPIPRSQSSMSKLSLLAFVSGSF